jgi:hypothetical protein
MQKRKKGKGGNGQAGKGDAPRNCHSKNFKENYDNIDWREKKEKKKP